MAAFGDVSDVEAALTRLAEREDGPFVVRLAREPGRRESRYAHLFSGEVVGVESDTHEPSGVAAELEAAVAAGGSESPGSGVRTVVPAPEMSFPASRQEQRLTRLEEEVQALRAELTALKQRLGE
jgi:uncharacterized protein YceH (UPF0502 family)